MSENGKTGETGNWRLDVTRANLRGRKHEISFGDLTADTLFVMDSDLPLANPSGAIESALTGYWRILNTAATLFSPAEWKTLADTHSPFCIWPL